MISGAIQYGVPWIDRRLLGAYMFCSRRDDPKSASLTLPLGSHNTFAPAMSVSVCRAGKGKGKGGARGEELGWAGRLDTGRMRGGGRTLDVAVDDEVVVQEVQALQDLPRVLAHDLLAQRPVLSQAVAQRALA
jgi:hypothetical protein